MVDTDVHETDIGVSSHASSVSSLLTLQAGLIDSTIPIATLISLDWYTAGHGGLLSIYRSLSAGAGLEALNRMAMVSLEQSIAIAFANIRNGIRLSDMDETNKRFLLRHTKHFRYLYVES